MTFEKALKGKPRVQ